MVNPLERQFKDVPRVLPTGIPHPIMKGELINPRIIPSTHPPFITGIHLNIQDA
jgi:hypothetical protein